MTSVATNIHPLTLLADRLNANIAVLAWRDATLALSLRQFMPSQSYCLIISGNEFRVGTTGPAGVTPLPVVVSPATATATLRGLFPSGACDRSAIIVGEDLGWLWNAVYRAPCKVAMLPSHRPPLQFLIRDIERLWVMLHIQDWTELLADPRVILLVGDDCVERFRAQMIENPMLPWPLASIIIDTSLWPTGLTLDAVRAEAQNAIEDRLRTLGHMQKLTALNAPPLTADRPLRVLGITSRYTTFLKHSMRDWLAAFDRLGHTTNLLIESADHELPNSLAVAETCLDFQPDLVLAIDHYRAEMVGVPEHIPMVMWVQDYLPNIFSKAAGKAQTDCDYTLGFAGLKLIHEFDYPAERFIPAVVGVDETRFSNDPCLSTDIDALRCQASFVSHASTSAESILKTEIDRLASSAATRLLSAIFDQLRAVYDGGNIVTEPIVIDRMIHQAMRDTRTEIEPDKFASLSALFTHRINNAMFRHQPLQWLADAGVDLRLYGNGWDQHPTLKKFARGSAEHGQHLRQIYQASEINLQITPHGTLHQRLFEGLSAGGFFLLRHVPGDELERHLLAIARWCDQFGIEDDAELRARANESINAHIKAIATSLQLDPFAMACPLVQTARWSQTTGGIRSAGTVWGDDYDTVAFASRDQLLQKTEHYLAHPEERRQIAERMRAVVIRRFTYTATCKRLLAKIAGDDAGMPRLAPAA